ncbi:MAG: hypothetical protein WD077_07910 [Bacteroidia bacterium]
MEGIYEVIVGSLVLSLVHAAIPSHWLPVVAISKTENWSLRETLVVTLIAGSAHTISTILLGLLIGYMSLQLSSIEIVQRYITPGILMALGVYYLVRTWQSQTHHHHIPEHLHSSRSKAAIIISLAVGMFFSPCLELTFIYLRAGSFGWAGLGAVTMIYLIVPVLAMVILVTLSVKGIQMLNLHIPEKYEKLVTGIVLVLLGLVAMLAENVQH